MIIPFVLFATIVFGALQTWRGRSGDWLVLSGFACAFFAAVLLAAGPVQAQGHVYSWTDKDGTVHFSNTGPPPADAKNVSKRVMPRHERRDVPQREGNAEIPFVFMGGDRSRRFVRVVLEGSRKRKNVLMLVDTGAQMTLIDERLANELNVEHVEDVAIMGVTGTMPAWMGRLHSLELGDEELKSPLVMVGPRNGMLLLGMDVLGKLKLVVGQKALQKE